MNIRFVWYVFLSTTFLLRCIYEYTEHYVKNFHLSGRALLAILSTAVLATAASMCRCLRLDLTMKASPSYPLQTGNSVQPLTHIFSYWTTILYSVFFFLKCRMDSQRTRHVGIKPWAALNATSVTVNQKG